MATTYCITGGGGNLALQLSAQLVADGQRVVLIDIADRPDPDLIAGCEYVRVDLTQPEEVDATLGRCKPDTVIHLASLLSGQSEQDRAQAWKVNATASFDLFEAALRHDVSTFFFTSTVAVYGGPLPDQLAEDQPQWPEGLYGAGKVAVERLGHYYHKRHGLDFRCVRMPLVISRYAHAGASSAYASMAFIETVATGSYTFKVKPHTRVAAIYILDALAAIRGLIDAPAAKLSRRVYTIQAISPTAQQIADVITTLHEGARIRFEPDTELCRLVDTWPQSIEDTTARRDWNWNAQYDLETMARHFIEELRRESTDARRLPTAGR